MLIFKKINYSFFSLYACRISDFRLAIKKAAPMITEKFQFGVEAQFARMLFAVVALFYVSWTTIVVSSIIDIPVKDGCGAVLTSHVPANMVLHNT